MLKIVSAVAASAAIAGFITIFPGATPAVEANASHVTVKGDRLPIAAPSCPQQAWPYFETACKGEGLRTSDRKVRLVTTDRI